MSGTDLHVGWDDYHRCVERLALAVNDSGWTFDAIVCLARGGLRVGDILSRIFERPLGILFTSSYRGGSGTEQGALRIGEHLCSAGELPGPRWLLVDDLVDSGVTFEAVIPLLRERYRQLRELRTAVIWQKGASVVQPDYVVEFLPSDPWIHQPFEIYDRLRPDGLRDRLASK